MVEQRDNSGAKTTFVNMGDYPGGGGAKDQVEVGDVPTPPPDLDGMDGGGESSGWYGDHPAPPHSEHKPYPSTMGRVEHYGGLDSLRREAPSDDDKAPSTVSHSGEVGILDSGGDDNPFVEGGITSEYEDGNTMVRLEMVTGNTDGDTGVVIDTGGDDYDENTLDTVAPSLTVAAQEKAVCVDVSQYVGRSVGEYYEKSGHCLITKGVCRNGCETKTIKVSVKKRVQNKKTLLWSDRSRKVNKLICVKGHPERANLDNSGLTGSEKSGSENARLK